MTISPYQICNVHVRELEEWKRFIRAIVEMIDSGSAAVTCPSAFPPRYTDNLDDYNLFPQLIHLAGNVPLFCLPSLISRCWVGIAVSVRLGMDWSFEKHPTVLVKGITGIVSKELVTGEYLFFVELASTSVLSVAAGWRIFGFCSDVCYLCYRDS